MALRTLAFLLALVLPTAALSTPAFAQSDDLTKRHQQMLYAVVQVQAGPASGSGTVIHSAIHGGDYETFVLTNFHVVGSAVTVEEEWDPKAQKDVKRERREPVRVLWQEYNDLSAFVGTSGKTADIVAYDEAADLALLKIRDRERGALHVARLLPEGQALYMSEPVFAVGGGLGKPPFMSQGVLGYLHEQIEGYPYLLSTAPIIFGNSGGALFRRGEHCRCYEMIGVPSRVSAAWFTVVPHMAWSIAMETVREFLRENEHGFILGDTRVVEDADVAAPMEAPLDDAGDAPGDADSDG